MEQIDVPVENLARKTASFSQMSLYDDCGHRWKLKYLDKRDADDSSIYSVFGNFVHKAIELKQKGAKNPWIGMGKSILKWCRSNPQKMQKIAAKGDDPKYIKYREEYIQDSKEDTWIKAGFALYSGIFDWLNKEFPNHEFIDAEFPLLEPIPQTEYDLKGYIDLIIKTPDGFYHVIDFKTTIWGWKLEKKTDTVTQYQLTIYKKFLSEKLNIDPELIKVYFVLLKRKPPKDTSPYEKFEVKCKTKKMENSVIWLKKQIFGMKKGLAFKDKTSCKYCPWEHTPECP